MPAWGSLFVSVDLFSLKNNLLWPPPEKKEKKEKGSAASLRCFFQMKAETTAQYVLFGFIESTLLLTVSTESEHLLDKDCLRGYCIDAVQVYLINCCIGVSPSASTESRWWRHSRHPSSTDGWTGKMYHAAAREKDPKHFLSVCTSVHILQPPDTLKHAWVKSTYISMFLHTRHCPVAGGRRL